MLIGSITQIKADNTKKSIAQKSEFSVPTSYVEKRFGATNIKEYIKKIEQTAFEDRIVMLEIKPEEFENTLRSVGCNEQVIQSLVMNFKKIYYIVVRQLIKEKKITWIDKDYTNFLAKYKDDAKLQAFIEKHEKDREQITLRDILVELRISQFIWIIRQIAVGAPVLFAAIVAVYYSYKRYKAKSKNNNKKNQNIKTVS